MFSSFCLGKGFGIFMMFPVGGKQRTCLSGSPREFMCGRDDDKDKHMEMK